VVDEKLLANIYSGMMPDACYPPPSGSVESANDETLDQDDPGVVFGCGNRLRAER